MPRTYSRRAGSTPRRHAPAKPADATAAKTRKKKSDEKEELAANASEVVEDAEKKVDAEVTASASEKKDAPEKKEKPAEKEPKEKAKEKAKGKHAKEKSEKTEKIEHKTRVIAVVNHKGGVGKTTCTMDIGAGLRRYGKTVLFIDADPQGSLSLGLGIDTKGKNTLYELLKGKCRPEKAIMKTKSGVDIIAADIMLQAAEGELSNEPGRDYLLSEVVDKVKEKYDYILIDCPPALGMLTLNALVAATEALIVVKPEFYSIQGIKQLEETFNVVRKRLNKNLKVAGIVINMYDARRKQKNKEAIDAIQEMFDEHIFASSIRNTAAVAVSPSEHEDIFAYSAKEASDFDALVKEIIDMEGK